MKDLVKEIRKELLNNADEKTKASSRHFFKEEVVVHGVKVCNCRQNWEAVL